jgi:hypothetical protein
VSSGFSKKFDLIANSYRRANRSVLPKRIELITNLIIAITSTLLCVVLIKNYLFSRPTPGPPQRTVIQAGAAPDKLESGRRISLPGVDWTKNSRTLVLALSTTCHFCSESASFYKQITQTRASNVGLIAVLPQSKNDSNNYLKRLGVSVDELVQTPLSLLGVKGTPTLILIDSSGTVLDSWRGKLVSDQESAVISQVR